MAALVRFRTAEFYIILRKTVEQRYRSDQKPVVHGRTWAEALSRVETARMTFWTEIMNSSDYEIRDRLRASELLAKAEGDFIDNSDKKSGMTLEELIMAANGLQD